jgi:hypothetical protein
MRNAIAALVSALVSAASGVAATKYVLTSTKQISPKVMASLVRLKAVAPAVTVAAPSPGPAGPQGQRGEAGEHGAKGQTGPAIIGVVKQYEHTANPIRAGEWRTEGIEARCEEGEFIGGGFEASSQYVRIFSSHRSPQGWTVSAINEGEHEATVTAYVLCAD